MLIVYSFTRSMEKNTFFVETKNQQTIEYITKEFGLATTMSHYLIHTTSWL